MAFGNGSSRSGVSLWRRLWMNPALGWGCEIAPAGVSVMRWDGGAREYAPARWRPLPEGTVAASPLRENLLRPEEVRQALAGCLEALGRSTNTADHPADAVLVIPDQSARVFFLSFDSLPRRATQALPLIRWKLKKSVPFDIETATVSYVAQRQQNEWQVLAVAVPEAVIRQYEEMLESLGLQPRFVTLSALGSLGLVPAASSASPQSASSESVLLAKYSPPWLTMTILHQGSLRLFRSVSVTGIANGESREALAEVLEAIYPSVAYFQDNFGVPLQQVYLCGLGESSGAVAASLAGELHLRARVLHEGPAPDGWDAAQADRHLAALQGVARERRS